MCIDLRSLLILLIIPRKVQKVWNHLNTKTHNKCFKYTNIISWFIQSYKDFWTKDMIFIGIGVGRSLPKFNFKGNYCSLKLYCMCVLTSVWPILAAAIRACCSAWRLLSPLWLQQEVQVQLPFVSRKCSTSTWPRRAACTNTQRPELSMWPTCVHGERESDAVLLQITMTMQSSVRLCYSSNLRVNHKATVLGF